MASFIAHLLFGSYSCFQHLFGGHFRKALIRVTARRPLTASLLFGVVTSTSPAAQSLPLDNFFETLVAGDTCWAPRLSLKPGGHKVWLAH